MSINSSFFYITKNGEIFVNYFRPRDTTYLLTEQNKKLVYQSKNVSINISLVAIRRKKAKNNKSIFGTLIESNFLNSNTIFKF